MANPKPNELHSKWALSGGPGAKLNILYSDGLQQYWDWFGDSFWPKIPFIGTDTFGLAKAADLPADASSEEIKFYLAAKDLATKLNYLNTEIFDREDSSGNSLAKGTWPLPASDYDYYKTEVIPIFVLIIESLKVIQENVLISDPDGFNNSWGMGPFAPGQSPPENLPDLINDVFDTVDEFLILFPDVSISLQKDIQAVPDSDGLGPSPILSDANLEKSLKDSDPLWPYTPQQTHYIGFLVGPNKTTTNKKDEFGNTINRRKKPYLPVRLSPNYDPFIRSSIEWIRKRGDPPGWQQPKFSILRGPKPLVATSQYSDNVLLEDKDSDGIEVPLGLEITIVEIIPSETGVWVGFVSDDPRLDDKITNGQKRILYTKAQYIRIKESAIVSTPDPYLSEKILQQGAMILTPEADEIKPEDQNWTKMDPNEVNLKYYSFNEHNLKIIGKGDYDKLFYNTDTLAQHPTLRYSEGMFYFVVSDGVRRTEAEIIAEGVIEEESSDELNAAKKTEAESSFETIKQEAWNNLLNYFGKNTVGGNSNLYQQLYDKYFILADKKVNTNSVNPNNQKALFAIRACYIDSLPENRRPIAENFEPDSPFLGGKNYVVSLKVNEVASRITKIARDLTAIKQSIEEAAGLVIENANGSDFDIDAQITAVEELPSILNDFLLEQAPIGSITNTDFLLQMASEGISTLNNHLIEIGIKDNNEIGGDVRETISYILFSPDPEKLKIIDAQSNLLDPYLSKEELGGKKPLKRSAIPLKTALPLLRSKLEGTYGSRALHLFLSYGGWRPDARLQAGHRVKLYMDWMSSYMVPPVKIYLSKDPSSISPEEFDCDDAIRRLNESGPNVGLEEKLLQEQIYNDPACMQRYYEQFNEDTSAASPNLSKKQLEALGEISSSVGSVMENQYVKVLYTQFFNILDMESMMALIMACLQKKLGIALTAEAICETAIIKLIENIGVGPVQQAMLANALLSPDSEASKKFLESQVGAPPLVSASDGDAQLGGNTGELEDEILVLDSYYNGAPLATSLAMSKKEPSAVVKVIRELEKSGTHVQLVPGERPGTGDEINVPYGSLYVVKETYTEVEIENEKQRLKQLGYSEDEARSMLIFSGYLRPNPQQYEPLLASDDFSSPLATGLMGSPAAEWTPGAVQDIVAVNQTAQNWLNYMKGVLGLQAICELIVGDILAGLQDLLKNPGAFLGGGYKGWFKNFVDGLKKQFMPPAPVLKFPDNLMTDDHMGEYGEQLIKMMLSLVASILGQIASLLIRNALEQCLEEDSDIGPLGRPIVNPIEGISIPTIERADLPKIGGLSDDDVVAWLKDIIDNLNNSAQLCALLRGDATKQTLKNCLARTKDFWPVVYGSGIDTIYQIRVAFKKLGRQVDLDICDAMQSTMPDTLVNNLCDAVFDTDARCEHLKLSGLSEEECQEQIDREIEDLKSKVSGLASLSMFETNPLTNSFPPICGENGSFVVPPGLRDTMERITGNMLTNVKGSLLLDMNGLKFFSTPPRALLAASDPNELKNAYQMFTDAIKDPYKKQCLVLIGDPSNHERVFTTLNTNLHEIYPITYNKFIHYGNLSTFRAKSKKVQLAHLSPEQEQEAYDWAYDQAYNYALKVVAGEVEDVVVASQATIEIFNSIKATIVTTLEFYVGQNNQAQGTISDGAWAEEITEFTAKLLSIDTIIEEIEGGTWDGLIPPSLTAGDDEIATLINQAQEDAHDEDYDDVFQVIWNDSIDFYLEQRKQQLLDEAGYDPKVGSIEDSIIDQNFVLSDEEFLKDVKAYTTGRIKTPTPDFERSDMAPMHIGLLLQDDASSWTGEEKGSRPELLRAIPNESRDFVDQYFQSLFEKNENLESINNIISSEFTKDLKEIYLDKFVITLSELFGTMKNSLNSQSGGFLSNNAETVFAGAGWNVHKRTNRYHNFPGNIRTENHSNFILRRPWPLQTKLKEISNNPFDWYVMLRNYTGADLLPSDVYHRTFPEKWLEKASLIDQFDVENPSAFWDIISSAEQDEIADDSGNLHFYNWLRISPGLRKLLPIMAKNKRDNIDVNYVTPTGLAPGAGNNWKTATVQDPGFFPAGTVLNHNIAIAFMELTLAEALGLEHKRIKKIFPNMGDYISNSTGVVLSSDMSYTTAVVEKLSTLGGVDVDIVKEAHWRDADPLNTLYLGYHAMYLVFENTFRDPSLPFNQSPDKIIDYFSMDKEKVNKELYNFFDRFPPSMGSIMVPAVQANNIYKAAKNLETDSNFNSNILKYDLPFSEVVSNSVPGVDGEAITQEMVDIFSTVGGATEMAQLASQIQTINLNKSLINQNVSTVGAAITGEPTDINIESQLNGIKNISKLIKATLAPLQDSAGTGGGIVESDNSLSNEIYNFNFGDDLDPEIQDLINKIYPDGADAKNILKQYNSKYKTGASRTRPQDLPSHTYTENSGMKKALKVHPLNFKAQIFGEFLTKKFMDKFNEYYDATTAYDPDYVSENSNEFEKNLRHILATYGYSALQYAYSTQMFTKLKHSRLHGRGFMKKLWKKILKSPLVSGDGGADPRCKQLLEQISAPSTDDLKNTTTDFFQLEDIKPKIIKFYKKSLCFDVYETPQTAGPPGPAATVSLIEGMVMLIAKIYTLEMFLASVIAWDSFVLSDVFKDKSLISIIIKNISEDFDIEFLSLYANDILRKEKGLTEFELAKIRKNQSSIEYMIIREVGSISAIIKNMFTNSFPLSTDLQLNLIKNSDPDFRPKSPTAQIIETELPSNIEEFLITKGFATLFNEGGHEYVVDARLKNNVYTMNYGYPWKKNFVDHTQTNFKNLVTLNSDIYGFNTERPTPTGNKNYLHSLPMNYYHSSGPVRFSTNYSENNKEGFDSWKNSPSFGVKEGKTGYNNFRKTYWKHKNSLGNSDSFSYENSPETTYGNDLNAKLGNIIFQPYVKVEDWTFPDDSFNFNVNVYSESLPNGEPCEGATLLNTLNAGDYLNLISEQIHSFRSEHNNVLGCHMYGYIPLSAWSHFYSNIFMKAINSHDTLRTLYEKFGLKPFFKKISFGMRMLYSTSFPVMDSSKIDFSKFMESAFGTGKGSENPTALKNAKCLYGQRPYYITVQSDCSSDNFCPGKPQLLKEIQIPIIEVEKEVQSQENTESFTIGESDLFSLSELGTFTGATSNMVYADTEDFIKKLIENNDIANHLTKNTHQFFYKNLANELLSEIKTSPEFKMMFDYLFPMRRYMALSVILASDGLSKFIPEPTDVLEETKNSLKMIIDNLVNSEDYEHMPDPIANFLSDLELRKQGGTTGKDLDMTKELLKIILKTPFYILKGFVEITDPAVMTAKMIIDIVNMIVFTALSTAKAAANAAKQVISVGVAAARQILQQLEIQMTAALGTLATLKATLPGGLGDFVIIESDGPIEGWKLELVGDPVLLAGATEPVKLEDVIANLSPSQQTSWNEFEDKFNKLAGLQVDYITKKGELEGLENDLRSLEEKLDAPFPPGWPGYKGTPGTETPPPGVITLAEDKLNSLLKSPYLLPGLWAAMLPPMLPFGGGIVPPPAAPGFMAGPIPGTFPGMIYIALLLIDAIEEKTHDDIQKQKSGGDLNCEDEL